MRLRYPSNEPNKTDIYMYAAKTMLTYVTCEHLNKFHILDS